MHFPRNTNDGKRQRQPLTGAISAGDNQIFAQDELSGLTFLVDSGANVSLLPATAADKVSGNVGPPLLSVQSLAVRSYGYRRRQIALSGHRFTVDFVIADIEPDQGILGADFLRQYHLLPDCNGPHILKADTMAVIPCARLPSRTAAARISRVDATSRFHRLLTDRPKLITPTFHSKEPAHGVELQIKTDGQPVFAKACRLAPDKLAAAKKEFEALEKMGIIRRSDSQWSSPLHLVKKSDGSYRPCGDFRRLNLITKPDQYPIPYLSDSSSFLAGKTVFSKIDLVRGYHQIPVSPADRAKTAVITPFGLWEWVRTPFGLRNAAQAFQRLMHRVCKDLDFVFVYLDDILVASSSLEEHYHHLQQLFDRLEAHDLVVNVDKCELAVSTLDFLGHRISAAGSAPLPEKVEAVVSYPLPDTVEQLQQFAGMVNFYHKHIPHLGTIMAPLFDAISDGKKAKAVIKWTQPLKAAFAATKSALAAATLLAHPDPTAPLALTTDASDVGAGAVLEQWKQGRWQPVAFFSRKFQPAQTRYSTFDRELTAICLALQHFRHMLEGRQFTIFTDHKPLVGGLNKISDAVSPRQSRQFSLIAEFTSELAHITGKNNVVADAMSRQATTTQPTTPDLVAAVIAPAAANLPELAVAQANDPSLLQFVANYRGNKLKLGKVSLPDSPNLIWCELSRPQPRPLVPDSHRRRIVEQLHGLAHPGRKASVQLVRDRFFWPNLPQDVQKWVKLCLPCQRAKVQTHTKPVAAFIPVPTDRFDSINIDIVGPLMVSKGHRYLLTIVDRYTRWAEAIPLPTIDADVVANNLLLHWIARFGVPRTITSDRGSQFTSALWNQMSHTLGIHLITTPAYHPQSNGLVERMHRQLKAALTARLEQAGQEWVEQLPWILLAIRNTVKEDLGMAPATLVYGKALTLPGDVLPVQEALPHQEQLQQLQQFFSTQQPTPTAHHIQQEPGRPLPADTQYVFLRRDMHRTPLTPVYEGPYKVVSRANNTLVVQKGDTTDVVAEERCKRAWIESERCLAMPPRRGRPPHPGSFTQPPPCIISRPPPAAAPTPAIAPASQPPAQPPDPDRPASPASEEPPLSPQSPATASPEPLPVSPGLSQNVRSPEPATPALTGRPQRPRRLPARLADFNMD